MRRASYAFAALAALMGASGVSLAALAVHADGGEFARTASLFLILHAAALLGLSAHLGLGAAPRGTPIAAFALAIGAIVFSSDLAARAFTGARLFPMAAPTGGSLMILSWAALAVLFAAAALRKPAAIL
jgi:uncharacterized membrane protein YgdD (TMEM256/DUF423 family)